MITTNAKNIIVTVVVIMMILFFSFQIGPPSPGWAPNGVGPEGSGPKPRKNWWPKGWEA